MKLTLYGNHLIAIAFFMGKKSLQIQYIDKGLMTIGFLFCCLFIQYKKIVIPA